MNTVDVRYGWMDGKMDDGWMHRWLDDTLDQCGFVFLVGLIAQPVSVAELVQDCPV